MRDYWSIAIYDNEVVKFKVLKYEASTKVAKVMLTDSTINTMELDKATFGEEWYLKKLVEYSRNKNPKCAEHTMVWDFEGTHGHGNWYVCVNCNHREWKEKIETKT